MKSLLLLTWTMIIVIGINALIYWNRKSKIKYSFYLYGAAAWIIPLAFHTMLTLALKKKIETFFNIIFSKPVSNTMYHVFSSVSYNLLVCITIFLFLYSFKSLQKQRFEEAVGFGIGGIATKTILLGIALIFITLVVILIGTSFENIPNASKMFNHGTAFAVIIDIIFDIIIYVFSTVLIVYSFITKKIKWFWAAFVYQTFYSLIYNLFDSYPHGYEHSLFETFLVELESAIIALFGFIGLKILKDRWPKNYENEEMS